MTTVDGLELDKSRALWERARRVMPGGVNASARLNPALGHALFFTHGEGACLYDQDGNRYVDYNISHGASLLGHGHPAVVEAVQAAMARGVLCAYETELQVEVAEQLVQLFPGSEMVRYTCSGTETTWHALRIARAYTGRPVSYTHLDVVGDARIGGAEGGRRFHLHDARIGGLQALAAIQLGVPLLSLIHI